MITLPVNVPLTATQLLEKKVRLLTSTILLLLDHVDYLTDGKKACGPAELVGAVLPREVILMARNNLDATR
jgi:hypothetical protein